MSVAMQQYPATPGWKTSHPETSKAAAHAETSRASILRTQVVDCYHHHGKLTSDECSELLGESILSIRPRISELHKCVPPALEDSGLRRKNKSGHSACVWQISEKKVQPELGLFQ